MIKLKEGSHKFKIKMTQLLLRKELLIEPRLLKMQMAIDDLKAV